MQRSRKLSEYVKVKIIFGGSVILPAYVHMSCMNKPLTEDSDVIVVRKEMMEDAPYFPAALFLSILRVTRFASYKLKLGILKEPSIRSTQYEAIKWDYDSVIKRSSRGKSKEKASGQRIYTLKEVLTLARLTSRFYGHYGITLDLGVKEDEYFAAWSKELESSEIKAESYTPPCQNFKSSYEKLVDTWWQQSGSHPNRGVPLTLTQACDEEPKLTPVTETAVIDPIVEGSNDIVGSASLVYTMTFNASQEEIKRCVDSCNLSRFRFVDSVDVGPANAVNVRMKEFVLVDGFPAEDSVMNLRLHAYNRVATKFKTFIEGMLGLVRAIDDECLRFDEASSKFKE